jgi:hypothetical protein
MLASSAADSVNLFPTHAQLARTSRSSLFQPPPWPLHVRFAVEHGSHAVFLYDFSLPSKEGFDMTAWGNRLVQTQESQSDSVCMMRKVHGCCPVWAPSREARESGEQPVPGRGEG